MSSDHPSHQRVYLAHGVCQIRYRGMYRLRCPHRESGGRQCERLDPHPRDSGHAWGLHTIMHERAGNGHSCLSVDLNGWNMTPFFCV